MASSPQTRSSKSLSITAAERERMIAEAAYYLAEQRGFEGGEEAIPESIYWGGQNDIGLYWASRYSYALSAALAPSPMEINTCSIKMSVTSPAAKRALLH